MSGKGQQSGFSFEARKFGNYDLQKFLGEGGMGQVFLARHRVMHRLSALKILPKELASEGSFIRRFRSEAQLMASLSNPHIVAIYNYDRCNQDYFIEMEFVDGGDLQQKIHAHRRGIPADEVLQLLKQILQAVAYAHGRSVIHRDLKPSNILLDDEGRIKIADFGLAAVLGQSFQNSLIEKSMTRSQLDTAGTLVADPDRSGSSIGGTLAYMSPQALHGERPAASDDIYAVGVIAYYMLTGRLPSVSYKRPSKVIRGLDRGWDAFVAKALEEDPKLRYRSAEATLEALGRITSRRRGTAVWMSAALLTMAIGGAWFWGGEDFQERLSLLNPLDIFLAEETVPIEIDGRPQRVEMSFLSGGGARGRSQELELPTEVLLPVVDEPYLLQFSQVDYEPQTVSIDPQRGPSRFQIELEPLRREQAFFVQTLRSGTEVWLDEQRLGRTPLEVNLEFSRDSSSEPWQPLLLRLHHKDYADVSLQVGVDDGPELPFVNQELIHQDVRVPLADGVEMRFVRILPGSFVMGSPAGEVGRTSDENQKEVSIENRYLVAATEVTQEQYRAIMGSNPSYHRRDGSDRPVEQVLFRDLVGENGFLDRFNRHLREIELDEWRADLPTEAEWEYACRAGTTSAVSSGFDLENSRRDNRLDQVAVYAKTETAAVGSLQPNAWGLYDMHGNVWEWTADGVLRGGSFSEGAASARSASRLRGHRDSRSRDQRFGFRLVMRFVGP